MYIIILLNCLFMYSSIFLINLWGAHHIVKLIPNSEFSYIFEPIRTSPSYFTNQTRSDWSINLWKFGI